MNVYPLYDLQIIVSSLFFFERCTSFLGIKLYVVMEGRTVLVAVAGRRDGVRVYASEEVRRTAEWRIDIESPERNGSTTAGGDERLAGQCHTPGQRGRVKNLDLRSLGAAVCPCC